MAAKKVGKPTNKDYADLGKAVQGVLLGNYLTVEQNKKRLLGMSFLRGLASGFGGVLGATVVVALLIWLLTVFGQVPVVGEFFNSTKETIQR